MQLKIYDSNLINSCEIHLGGSSVTLSQLKFGRQVVIYLFMQRLFD